MASIHSVFDNIQFKSSNSKEPVKLKLLPNPKDNSTEASASDIANPVPTPAPVKKKREVLTVSVRKDDIYFCLVCLGVFVMFYMLLSNSRQLTILKRQVAALQETSLKLLQYIRK